MTRREEDQQHADDFALLVHALTVGRRWAMARYGFIVAGGIASWFAPSEVFRQQATSTTVAACSVLWIACGITCLVSAVRDRRTGEYLGIPGVMLGLAAFVVALGWDAFHDDPVVLPYAMFLGGLVASLGKRQAELRALRSADIGSRGGFRT